MVHNQDPFNAEPPPEALAATEITPVEAFYCRNHGPIPDIAAPEWRLHVGGTVAEPLSLTYDDLTGYPAHDVVATLECAGNRRAELLAVQPIPGKEPWAQAALSTAVWRGARLSDVLRDAGVRSEGEAYVAFVGADATPFGPFGASIPLGKARADEVLLVWAMNGASLPRIHGGPVRGLVPGFIGARSVKWLTGISVQPTPSDNHFQAVDYRVAGVALSTLQLNCAILTPTGRVDAGPLMITGYAVAPDTRRIARVEVSTDGGHSWATAQLESQTSRWAWRHWSLTVTAEPGPLTVIARAVDDTGATQPESAAALWNPDGYANNAWARVQLTVD